MTTQRIVLAAAAALVLSLPGGAQTASDLLQKGIHAQEASGDLDVAIAIFRQVESYVSTNDKPVAGQARYQLILCMLQKGDREAASKELAALERGFADMPDLVAKARKLIPATSTLLPEPWGEGECEQLNIKRVGVATGEYLQYSALPWVKAVDANNRQAWLPRVPSLTLASFLQWKLKTSNSTRSIRVLADHDTMRPMEGAPWSPLFSSDDDLGDSLAAPFSGPATDQEQSIFRIRRLPLAVGYKTTLPVTSNRYAAMPIDLSVTGIETVQTLAGKFNCYKVVFAAIGQTFWIGVEGQHSFVKFQSGNVEAELVKVWGPVNMLESLESLAKSAGAKLGGPGLQPNGDAWATLQIDNVGTLNVSLFKIHTPVSEIVQALERAPEEKIKELRLQNPYDGSIVRPGSVQTRMIGGQQALSCLIDYTIGSNKDPKTRYIVWIRTEKAVVELGNSFMDPYNVGVFRWRFDPIIDAIRIQ